MEDRPAELAPLLDDLTYFVQRWGAQYKPQALLCYEGPSCLRIEDRRFNLAPRSLTFGKDEKDIYLACREPSTPEQVEKTLAARPEGAVYDAADVRGFLDSLVRERLALREGDRYLSLAERFGGPSLSSRDTRAAA